MPVDLVYESYLALDFQLLAVFAVGVHHFHAPVIVLPAAEDILFAVGADAVGRRHDGQALTVGRPAEVAEVRDALGDDLLRVFSIDADDPQGAAVADPGDLFAI